MDEASDFRLTASKQGFRLLLPDSFTVSEQWGPVLDAPVFQEESEQVINASFQRRMEFGAVRVLARKAMEDLKIAPSPILRGAEGAPIWPDGVIGSMTHCAGFRGVALSKSKLWAAVGIDAEPSTPLPVGVLELVAFGDELGHLDELSDVFPSIQWKKLMFSAKEAIYKAWFPRTHLWLGFEDVALSFDPLQGTFCGEILVQGLEVAGNPVRVITGKWLSTDELVLTAATVPRDR